MQVLVCSLVLLKNIKKQSTPLLTTGTSVRRGRGGFHCSLNGSSVSMSCQFPTTLPSLVTLLAWPKAPVITSYRVNLHSFLFSILNVSMLVIFSLNAWDTNDLVSIVLCLAVFFSFILSEYFLTALSHNLMIFSVIEGKFLLLGRSELVLRPFVTGCRAQWKKCLQKCLQRLRVTSFIIDISLSEKSPHT